MISEKGVVPGRGRVKRLTGSKKHSGGRSMIELKVTNGQNPVKVVKLCLPEEQAYLREKLKKIGVEENKYEITVVRCYPGNLERFIKKE